MLEFYEKFEIIFTSLRNSDLDGSKSLIYQHSTNIKKLLNIPDNLNVVWFNLQHESLYNHIFDSHFNKIKQFITSSDQIIVLSLLGYHMPLNNDMIVNLNKFSQSLPNTIILCGGSLGSWSDNFETPILFTVSQLMYYEFELFLYAHKKFFTQSDAILNNTKKNKKFLFIGTKDYPNRKFLLSNIINNNLLDQGFVSYKQVFSKNLSSGLYTDEEIQLITSVANSIDDYLPLPVLDNSINYMEMPIEIPLDSYLNMVTDTFFESAPNTTFLSEKVFYAIANWQMFIVMSPAYTLRYLREQGYQTFGNYIDESYDTIENNCERLIAVTKSFIDFISQPIEIIEEVYIKCLPIIEHNRQRLLDNQFITKINNELLRAIEENKLFH